MINKMTKIICTIGPASDNYQTILKMANAGMNIVRLNFSHGTHEEHLQRINLVRKVEKENAINLGIMLDTKGPEIRLGKFVNEVENYTKGVRSSARNSSMMSKQTIISWSMMASSV